MGAGCQGPQLRSDQVCYHQTKSNSKRRLTAIPLRANLNREALQMKRMMWTLASALRLWDNLMILQPNFTPTVVAVEKIPICTSITIGTTPSTLLTSIQWCRERRSGEGTSRSIDWWTGNLGRKNQTMRFADTWKLKRNANDSKKKWKKNKTCLLLTASLEIWIARNLYS